MSGNREQMMNKNAILVHQLPFCEMLDCLELFKKECNYIKFADLHDKGLRICFKNYDWAKKYIRRRVIEVKGISYNIYPMVTNLTVRGIAAHTGERTLKDLEETLWNIIRESYGSVMDLYRAKSITEILNQKIISNTDDYRIILYLPEVLAKFSLKPVMLPESSASFEVLFFCRLCRKNGHMQFQCRTGSGPSFRDTFLQPSVLDKYFALEHHENQEEIDEDDHLSPGMRNAIKKIHGVLTPARMHQFLKQARNRKSDKKLLDITRYFTTDIAAVVAQLNKIQRWYYVHGKREKGADEARDITFISGLRKRLKK